RRLRDRRVRPAAVADDLGGHALPDRALRLRVREQRPVAVAVRVDEAGAPDPSTIRPSRMIRSATASDDRFGIAVLDDREIRDAAAEPRIEDVPEPVAEEVEAEDADRDRGPGP